MSVKILKILRKKTRVREWATLKYLQRHCCSYLGNIGSGPTRYARKANVTILPGSGIGHEIMSCTLEVLKAAGAPLSYEILPLSSTGDSESGEFENALISIRRNKVALKGNIETQSKNPYAKSRNIFLRKTLDLFVYILPCKTFPGLANKFGEIDIVVIRQNTEGEYLMLEHEPRRGSVESLKILTRYNSERLAVFAFEYAIANKRKLITAVHNADVHVLAEGMFLTAIKNVSKKYPQIKLDVLEVGVAVVKLSANPQSFDMILASNLNGGMVCNFLSGMIGGPGLSSGINFSNAGIAVFEPGARNKGSSIVGRGIANPVAMIMAGINLLNYLGYHKTAEIIKNSIFLTLVKDKIHTLDLGGKATSKEITQNVIHHIKEQQMPKSQKKKDHLLHHRWKAYCNVPEEKLPKKNVWWGGGGGGGGGDRGSGNELVPIGR